MQTRASKHRLDQWLKWHGKIQEEAPDEKLMSQILLEMVFVGLGTVLLSLRPCEKTTRMAFSKSSIAQASGHGLRLTSLDGFGGNQRWCGITGPTA